MNPTEACSKEFFPRGVSIEIFSQGSCLGESVIRIPILNYSGVTCLHLGNAVGKEAAMVNLIWKEAVVRSPQGRKSLSCVELYRSNVSFLEKGCSKVTILQ